MNPLSSFILRSAAAVLFFVAQVFAVYLLLRGHDLPGGGFIAGLASAIATILMGMAMGFREFEKWMRFDAMKLSAIGLLVAVGAALAPLLPFFPGERFFEHHMFHPEVPWLGKLHVGTTLIFDVGVLLVVVGISIKVVSVLARSISGRGALPMHERERYASRVETPVEEGNEELGEDQPLNEMNRGHHGS